MDVNRELEVSRDRLKPEIPTPKGRVKPLFWTSKWLSERRIETQFQRVLPTEGGAWSLNLG